MYLKKTRPLLDELSNLIKSTNSVDLWKRFEPSIDICNTIIGNTEQELFIDIIFYGTPSSQEKEWVGNYFEQPMGDAFFESKKAISLIGKCHKNTKLNILFWNWEHITASFFEQRKTITFCILFSETANSPDLNNHIKLLIEDSVWVYLFSVSPWTPKSKETISSQVGNANFEHLNTLQEKQMTDDISSILNDRTLEIGQAYAAMRQVHKIHHTFLRAYSEIKQNIAVKKIQLTQKMVHCQQKIKQNQGNRNDFKDIVNFRIGQFETRFKSVMEQIFSPPLGQLIQLAESRANELEDLLETKKAKQIEFTIDADFENTFLTDFRYYCTQVYLKEKKESLKCTRTIERELSRQLSIHGLELNMKRVEEINEQSISHLLQHKIYFDRNFNATVTDRGIMEYIMGARMYYMYIMMGASMLGFNIRFIPGGKQLLIPIAILLIGFGVFQVWSSKQNEKEENQEKHLKSAQDFLNAQTKKISQDVSRLFEKLIQEETRKKNQQLLLEAERLIQLKKQSQQRKNDIEKIKVDRLLKNISNQERTLDMLTRSQTTFERNLDRLQQDLKTALKPKRTERAEPTIAIRNKQINRLTTKTTPHESRN